MPRRRRTISNLLLSAAPLWIGAAWLAASGITCATGSNNPTSVGAGGSGASSSASGPSTTAASASSSASGATTASSGGGATSSSSSATASASATSSVASSGSSSCSTSSGSSVESNAETILTVTTGSSTVGDYEVLTTMSGFANPWNSVTQHAIGLAFTGNGLGVAVIRSDPLLADAGTPGELLYATWNGSWSPGFGQALLPVQGTPTLTITGAPSLVGGATKAHCAYQGADMNFYYAAEFNGSWGPTNEPIPNGAAQSTGPVPPAIAALGDDPTIAFIGPDGDVYDQTRTCGAWSAPHAHGVPGQTASITPTIIALTQGPELLLVYSNAAASNLLMYTVRNAGTWTTPAALSTAQSGAQVSLAPLTAGGAVLAYVGLDGLLYTSILSTGASPTWSSPVAGVNGSIPTLAGPPAVASGPSGSQAILLYVDTSFITHEATMSGGAWGAPGMAGSSDAWIAIATGH